MFLNLHQETIEESNFDKKEKTLENLEKFCFAEKALDFPNHSIVHYDLCLYMWGTPGFHPTFAVEINRFVPKIETAQLINHMKREGKEIEELELRITGTNLIGLVPNKCSFSFGCPFFPFTGKTKTGEPNTVRTTANFNTGA